MMLTHIFQGNSKYSQDFLIPRNLMFLSFTLLLFNRLALAENRNFPSVPFQFAILSILCPKNSSSSSFKWHEGTFLSQAEVYHNRISGMKSEDSPIFQRM